MRGIGLPRVVVLILLLAAWPSGAAAGPAFASSAVTVDGTAATAGEATALFAATGLDSLVWQVQASSARIDRTYVNYTAFYRPLSSNPVYEYFSDTQHEQIELEDVAITSGRARPGGAILVRGATAPFALDAQQPGGLDLQATTDPTLHQGNPPTAEADSGETFDGYRIHERVPGTWVNLTGPEGVYSVQGDLVLTLSDLDYEVASKGRVDAMRTGNREVFSAGPMVRGAMEIHRVVLRNATLHLASAEPVTLLAFAPLVTFEGRLQARDPEGEPPATDLVATQAGKGSPAWSGKGSMTFQPEGGLLTAKPPPALAPEGTPVATTAAPWPALAVGVLVAFALVVAFLAWRSRALSPDAELVAALLAMEEHRWEDAIPRLDRVLRAQPEDAGLLVDRAICLEKAGRLDEARAGFEHALARAPAHAEAHLYYARALARANLRSQSIHHLRRALLLDPRLEEMARTDAVLRRLD